MALELAGSLDPKKKNSLRATTKLIVREADQVAHTHASKRVHVIKSLKLGSVHVPGVKSGASVGAWIEREGNERGCTKILWLHRYLCRKLSESTLLC